MSSGPTMGAVTVVAVLALAGCSPATSSPTATDAGLTPGPTPSVASPSGATTVIPPQPGAGTVARLVIHDPRLIHRDDPENFEAPNAYAVQGNTIFVSDDLSENRIYSYVDGKRTGSVLVPGDFGVLDMQIHDHQWYLFGTDKLVHVYAAPGAKTRKLVHVRNISAADTPNRKHPDEPYAVERIQFYGDNLVGAMDDQSLRLLDGPGPITQPSVQWVNDRTGILRDGAVNATIQLSHDTQGIERYTQEGGNTYYLVSEGWMKGSEIKNCVFLYEFGPDGKLVHTYTSEQAGDQFRPRSELVVSDGRVYRMLNTTEVGQIQLLAPNP